MGSGLRLPNTLPFLMFDYMNLLDFCGKKKKNQPDIHFMSLSA